MRGTSLGLLVASVVAMAGCDGGGVGSSSVRVTREGRPTQDFASVRFTCEIARPDPSSDIASLSCVHGDPSIGGTGLQLVAWFEGSLDDRPAGTTLEMGTDFTVSGFSGAGDGNFFGASGDSSWWTGDLTLTLEERDANGRSAVFAGTLRTTAAVTDLVPIAVELNAVAATLP